MTGTELQPQDSDQPMLRIPRSAHPTPTHATRKSRRIPVLAYAAVILAVIAALVMGSQSLGWFRTTGSISSSTGERVAPVTGAPTSDIKGWMTLQQVLDAYPITQERLYSHFAIPATTTLDTTLSELKEGGASSLDVPTLRSWIDDGAPA